MTTESTSGSTTGTPPIDDGRPSLPPDPVAYDSPRNARARAKGLDAPYIAGGTDPDPAKGLAEERKYVRLLVAMVVTLILAGFVLGIVIALALGDLAGNIV